MWDGVDRRRFVRARYPCLIKVHQSQGAAETILTHTEDLSAGGVRTIIRMKAEGGAEVDLEIDLMDTLKPVVAKGTVSRIRAVAAAQKGRPPRYEIAAEFSSLSEADRQRIERVVGHVRK